MNFDLAVIGAGPAGYVGAIKAAQLGMKVVVFERDKLGGTCLNRGCIPTKAYLRAAHVLEEAKLWSTLGITGEKPGFDFAAMTARKDAVVSQLQTGIAGLFKANGITLVSAEAKIVGANKVVANGEEYEVKNILIAAGSSPLRPPIPGIDAEGVWTSDELLSGKFVNELTIVGGGVIGMEFASMYAALGAKVTVIEALDRVLATVDKEIGQNLSMILKKRGVAIRTSCRVSSFERRGDKTVTSFTTKEGVAEEVSSQAVLVAIGRRGNAMNLADEQVGLAIERGQFVVDENHQTSVAGIWAVGDIAKGDVQLAHAASAYAIRAVEAMAGKTGETDTSLIPGCIFTDPEIATVGVTEDEAKAKGMEVKSAKYLMSGNGKTIIELAERSFIKVVAETATGKLVGAQLMCPHASDLVGELALAIRKGLSVSDVASLVHSHPTLAEGILEACESWLGTAIHVAPRRR